ncbi:hypothetical protein [Streptomyces achromogenes]|uniref:hypothetical protein n=1 Tax=Streptomyces achromogenes TaxID=67255 RepID=UPI001FD86A10|nr:hypothetical protein [Streptomyces achromogenes]
MNQLSHRAAQASLGGGKLGRVGAVFAGIILTVAMLGTAEAQENSQVDSVKAGFIAEARAAHLSSVEASALQAKVDSFMAGVKATQVAPNLINLADGGTIYVAVPGEAHFRDLTPGDNEITYDPCGGGSADSGYFCAYESPYFGGSSIPMYACHTYNIPFYGGGSWDNNQSTGTRARMFSGYNNAGTLVYTTPGARSYDTYGDWTPVGSVINC